MSDTVQLARSGSPSADVIKAAEELELDDNASEKLSSPTRPSPKKTPNKVKAAAAMWETGVSPSRASQTSPSSSFRSLPPSASKAPAKSMNNSPEKSEAHVNSSVSLDSPVKTLSIATMDRDEPFAEPATPKSAVRPPETFSEVSLENATPRQATSVDDAGSFISLSDGPEVDAPAVGDAGRSTGKAGSKMSLFSAIGMGTTSSPSTSLSAIESPKPSRSTSSSSQGGGWRSAMSNILGGRSTSSPSPTPPTAAEIPTIPSSVRSPQDATARSTSTAFIMSRVDSPTASRDRRISRQDGSTEKLREGFDRVRSEMEDAAREMRRSSKQTEDKANRASASGVDWVFWGAVVQDYEEVARTKPRELSKAIQQGIPPVIRGAIWQLMSSSKSTSLEDAYKALLKQTSPHEKAIVKDISRTFPNHRYFQEAGGVGQESLFMVVKAFSLYDQDVGYTQGLAFIVAALLLNMPDEEAFCVLVRLMDSYNLRSLFLADMPGLQLRLFQFDRLVEDILPLLHTHFLRKGVKSSMFASQWFMTLFSYRFPLSLVYRVLDIVFAEGIEAIFRFSIALLAKAEDTIVALEFEKILQFLQTDIFEPYRRVAETESPATETAEAEGSARTQHEDGDWRANDFVRDAYEVKITPFMLDSYESEYDDLCRDQNKHALELDQLRNANRSLSTQVKQLESSLATMNQEHVEIVRQLVMSKIEKEETENELVRYKMMYAELSHAQQDALSTHSRLSAGSAPQGVT